jgi:6-phosphogluconate dehydrogenase
MKDPMKDPMKALSKSDSTINWQLNPEAQLNLFELGCLIRADVAFGNQTTDATIN